MNETGNWRPTADIQALRRRAEILRAIRTFFDSRGFFEVQTPCLSRDVVVDRYIHPLTVSVDTGGGGQTFWLQTSPEFAMKRLLAAGADAIYQIGPAFRADELGDQHNLEFTMLEWYRVGDDYQAGMDLLDTFAQVLLDPCAAAKRLTYRDAFLEFAGIDPFVAGLNADQLNVLMSERVETGLAALDAVIIHDWPADQSALARTRTDERGQLVAERFELYVRGVELANGYHELVDADELLARNRRVNELRQQDGQVALPVDSRLIEAMRNGLPGCSGVALGIERLLMLALGATEIRSVMAFDSHRA